MDTNFRLKQDMGVRALEFSQANPSDALRYGEFVGELGSAVTDGRDLIHQYGEGRDAAHAAKEERQVLRKEALATFRDIVRIGKTVAVEVPALTGYFRVGRANISLEALLGRGRQFAAKVAEHQDQFAGFGFGPEKLAAFIRTLDALAGGVDRGSAAKGSHVGATADMRRIGNRILYFVDVLDAINRLRFQDDPEKLAAWISASSVAWPNNKAAKKARREKEQGQGQGQGQGQDEGAA